MALDREPAFEEALRTAVESLPWPETESTESFEGWGLEQFQAFPVNRF